MRSPIILRIIVILSALAIRAALAATEVTVQEGKVQAVTDKGAATVSVGDKGILVKGEQPTVIPDDPLVNDAMKLDGWAQEEKKGSPQSIAMIVSWAREYGKKNLRTAGVSEIGAKLLSIGGGLYAPERQTLRAGLNQITNKPVFYNMKGDELPVTVRPVTATHGFWDVQVGKALQPDGSVKCLAIMEEDVTAEDATRVGVLRYAFNQGDAAPGVLHYYRVILPESAIFVDSWPRPVSVDAVGGRIAVTAREFGTGYVDRQCALAFLWPEKDGSSTADLPPEYRGLREPLDVQLAEKYKWEMEKIIAGLDYRDQSTPVDALLSWNCAVLRWDPTMYAQCAYAAFKDAANAPTMPPADPSGWRTHFVDKMSFLATLPWPERPEEGCIHLIRMCYPGTFIESDVHAMTYHDGKWRWLGNVGSRRLPVSNQPGLEVLSGNNAGPEAVEFHRICVMAGCENPYRWSILGFKLARGAFWKEASDAFSRAEESGKQVRDFRGSNHMIAALIWQGHIYDIEGRREEALEKYRQALELVKSDLPIVRHDQWGIVINRAWIEARLKEPFTLKMMGK